MATPLGYQTFCPVGAALNVVGERWALLIVRDLLLGPRRYTELQTGLGGIPTDILADRLRTLREHTIVRQVGTGRARRYELTESGQALRPVLRELGRWGSDRLQLPSDPSEVPPRVPLTSLLIGATGLPTEVDGFYEIRVAPEVVRVTVANSEVHADPDCEPDTVIELTGPGLLSLIRGESAREIEEHKYLAVQGNRRLAHALLNALTGPPRLAGLRRQLQAEP